MYQALILRVSFQDCIVVWRFFAIRDTSTGYNIFKVIKTPWRILFPLNINDEKLRLLSEPPSSGGLEKKSLKTIFPPLCEDNDAPLPR